MRTLEMQAHKAGYYTARQTKVEPMGGRPVQVNQCKGCDHRRFPKRAGDHCYMHQVAPKQACSSHTSLSVVKLVVNNYC